MLCWSHIDIVGNLMSRLMCNLHLEINGTVEVTSISFSKKAGGRLAQSLYVFLHNAIAGSRGPGRGCACPEIRALYDIASIYGNGWRFGVFWGGFGCFNGPPDGYANS